LNYEQQQSHDVKVCHPTHYLEYPSQCHWPATIATTQGFAHAGDKVIRASTTLGFDLQHLKQYGCVCMCGGGGVWEELDDVCEEEGVCVRKRRMCMDRPPYIVLEAPSFSI